MINITESGMTFGTYSAENCFYIENSRLYRSMSGLKIAEFMLLRYSKKGTPVIWIVEAKSSSPRPNLNAKQAFDDFIDEIQQKLTNSLSLWFAMRLQRHPKATDELSEQFQAIDLANVDFRLVLVINGHQEEWLPPLQDALRKALLATVQTWALSPSAVLVFNHELAHQYKLITDAVK